MGRSDRHTEHKEAKEQYKVWKQDAKETYNARKQSLLEPYHEAIQTQGLGRHERHELRHEMHLHDSKKHAHALYNAETSLGKLRLGLCSEDHAKKQLTDVVDRQLKTVNRNYPLDFTSGRRDWTKPELTAAWNNTVNVPGSKGQRKVDLYGAILKPADPITGKRLWDVDHLQPKSSGGPSVRANLVACNPTDNRDTKRAAKDPKQNQKTFAHLDSRLHRRHCESDTKSAQLPPRNTCAIQ